MLIRRVEPTAAVSAVLRPNDVLLAFDGTPIANDGTVPFRSGERISFSYLVSGGCGTARLGLLAWGGGLVADSLIASDGTDPFTSEERVS